MSFAIIRRPHGKLWCVSVFYVPDDGPTRVTTSWHFTRADAVAELSGFFG